MGGDDAEPAVQVVPGQQAVAGATAAGGVRRNAALAKATKASRGSKRRATTKRIETDMLRDVLEVPLKDGSVRYRASILGITLYS